MDYHRRSIRMPGFDYSSTGAYFITICTHEQQQLFGMVENGGMRMNEVGKMIQNCWFNLTERYQSIELDEFIIMPNHFHGIIWIQNNVGAPLAGALSGRIGALSGNAGVVSGNEAVATTAIGKYVLERVPARDTPTLGNIVGGFKSITTVKYIKQSVNNPPKFWQRNYYEHIIRDEASLFQIRQYIRDNPMQWDSDPEHCLFPIPSIHGPVNAEANPI